MPVARTIDGSVLRENRPLGLTPTGEETDAELSYLVALGAGGMPGLDLVLQPQPGHDAGAVSAELAPVRYEAAF